MIERKEESGGEKEDGLSVRIGNAIKMKPYGISGFVSMYIKDSMNYSHRGRINNELGYIIRNETLG